jgi:hypothetical protein
MMTKNISAAFCLSLFVVSFIGAQSLAELSRKEKERRAALKGKITVVTNEDLAKVKKTPAITMTPAGTGDEEGQEAQNTKPPAEHRSAAGDERAPFNINSPAARGNARSSSAPPPAGTDGESQQTRAQLEERVSEAGEAVDLLTTKMKALWQQFYNMDTMGTRDKVQLEISETNDKLLKAREDMARAEEELNNYVSRPGR